MGAQHIGPAVRTGDFDRYSSVAAQANGPCFGYRSATLPVFDPEGNRLALNADAGGIAVGDDSRLLLQDGTSIANLFGIGLGTGYRLPASMGGEPNFDGQANSLWLYQNDIGAVIYRAIQQLLPAPEVKAKAAAA